MNEVIKGNKNNFNLKLSHVLFGIVPYLNNRILINNRIYQLSRICLKYLYPSPFNKNPYTFIEPPIDPKYLDIFCNINFLNFLVYKNKIYL